MNIIKRAVKEALLVPFRVLQGIDAAVAEVTEGKDEGGKKGTRP